MWDGWERRYNPANRVILWMILERRVCLVGFLMSISARIMPAMNRDIVH